MPGAVLLVLAILAVLAAPVLEAAPTPRTAPAPAGEGEGARARLAQPEVLRGHFVQEKQLEGFRNPLRSRGGFLLLRGRGVAWDTVEPFATSTVLTHARLLTTMPDGSSRLLLDAEASPGMATVNALLMALVAGDLDTLAPQFTLTETPADDGAWTLELRPRDADLQRVFARIELRGDRHVREVRIEETAGDRTTIVFQDLVEAPEPTASELARFD
jgi:hypothetical protein